MKSSSSSRVQIIRCKYYYRIGHHDSQCKQKEAKRPPYMPDWVSKATCRKCKKKGHLAFNCPPKYENNPYKSKNDVRNRKEHISETAANVTEFAGSATHYVPNLRILPTYKSPSFAYRHHLKIMRRICKQNPHSANRKFQKIMQHLHNNDPRFNLYKKQIISFFMSHFNRMSQENLITIIWVLSHLHSTFLYKNYHYKRTPILNLHKHKGLMFMKV